MLPTAQPVLRRFWYPVMPLSHLASGPAPFTLLGEPLALWLDQQGQPAAVHDSCCHRQAKLSQGRVVDGNLLCPYHGWQFGASGQCVAVPQQPDRPIPESYRVNGYLCRERYGYVWVCLSHDPLDQIPEFKEAEDPHYRIIHAFYEQWHCGGLRLMENAFDHGHHHFVHHRSLGDRLNPVPLPYNDLHETNRGIYFESPLYTHNNERLQKSVHIADETLEIKRQVDWYLPFGMYARMTLPNGLIHNIVMYATPIADDQTQVVRFYFRNDTEEHTPAADAIAFERTVLNEDKAILETTDYDAPLDLHAEVHIATDKPGMLMRRKLAALLQTHAEKEQRRGSNDAIAE
jgi:phenylpropionate dioxygenase-like ring-hydroxylating dioxygenase large terminal subunit